MNMDESEDFISAFKGEEDIKQCSNEVFRKEKDEDEGLKDPYSNRLANVKKNFIYQEFISEHVAHVSKDSTKIQAI